MSRTAERIDRLRPQAHVAQDRNAARRQELDRLGHFVAAFQLHARAAGLDHDPGRVVECLLRGFLITAERQIHDHAGMFRPPDHGAPMRRHHV